MSCQDKRAEADKVCALTAAAAAARQERALTDNVSRKARILDNSASKFLSAALPYCAPNTFSKKYVIFKIQK